MGKMIEEENKGIKVAEEGERTEVDKSLLPFHWVTNLTVGRERKEESETEEK